MRLKYYQLRDYLVRNMKLTVLLDSDIWDCFYTAKDKSLISTGYKSFSSYKEDDCGKLAVRWSQKTGTNIATNNISSTLSGICRSVNSSNLRLQQFRTICFLYLTPERIVKWSSDGSTSDRTRCPKCDLYAADLQHMFFHCPALTEFWRGIEKIMSQKLGRPILFTVVDVMLGGQDRDFSQRDLITILHACARLTIARV